MDAYDFSFVGVTATNLVLAAFVYISQRRALVNQLFALQVLFVALWSFSGFLIYADVDPELDLFWERLAFSSASLIALSFLFFALAFPYSSRLPPVPFLVALLLGLSITILTFTPLIVREVTKDPDLQITRGPLYPLFGLYFLAFFGTGIGIIIKRWRSSKGLHRLRIQYFLLGVLLTGLGGITTNLLIPLIFHTSKFSPYGRYFTLIYIVFTVHALVRYRLMGMNVIIQKGVVYICAITATASIFVGLIGLASYVTAYGVDNIPLGAAVAMAVMVAILFTPLKSRIETVLNRYVYRQAYNYQLIVREASKRLSAILDIHSLLDFVAEVIVKTLRVEMAAVYMRDDPQHTFALRTCQTGARWEQQSVSLVLPGKSPLVAFLERQGRHLVSDETFGNAESSHFTAAVKELKTLGGEIAFPFLEDHTVLGITVVGPKLSGDPYLSEDIDLLTTLVNQASIAIKNAQLHRQVVLVNEYIENILATIESGVIAVAADGTVTLFNSAAERMTQLDAKDVKGSSLQKLPISLAASLHATITDGQPRPHVETVVQDDADRLTPVICSTSILKDRSHAILGAVAVFSDLTKLKELEGEKRRAERLASIGALASGIAHEIKNPLVAIRTFAELLPERFTEEDFRGEFSKVAIREIERIDDLVARLRGLAAPSAEPLTPLDLRGPMEETLVLLRGQLEQKRITVKRTYESKLPPVAGDPAQLKQLFLNLFMNALEGMEPGGELTICLGSPETFGSKTLVVEIVDTGTGIPEALLDKIFDPFVTTKPRGSGLGLSICRGIADAHGAKIHIWNNPNRRGTTVIAEFPVVQGMPATTKTLS